MVPFIEKIFSWLGIPKSEDARLICTYRYISLLITSFFYLFKGSLPLIGYRFTVVISLFLAAGLITDIYMKYSGHSRQLKAAILSETLIITLLLIPTGGLNSPFIWYALNPVLVAAWYLSAYFCWFNLFFYIVISTIVNASIFNKQPVIQEIVSHSNLLLIFTLVTFLVQLLAALLKHLNIANSKQRESLEHIMSFYKIIEAFTNEDDLHAFFQTVTNYASKLTKARASFFWQKDIEQIYFNENIDECSKSAFGKKLSSIIVQHKINTSMDFEIFDKNFKAVVIKSSSRLYGILGIQIDEAFHKPETTTMQQLSLLSDLSSMILERFSIEENNKKMTLLEERNRIANEIHDNVSQRLFSISCALYSMKSKWGDLQEKDVQDELSLLGNSANLALRELRQSIYRLSTLKSGEKMFFPGIKAYLRDLSELNDIEIKVDLTGEEEIISARLKKSLYRIICEATGNAVKHGKASQITVKLEINSQSVLLVIEDNGTGFDINRLRQENTGIGLINMKNIALSFGGKYVLESKNDIGTRLKVEIPILQLKEHGGIA